MKQRLFFFAVLLTTAFGANAQTEQGNYLVGGNLQLSTPKNNTLISFSPMAGYFFADNFAAGANINLGYSKKGENTVTSTTKTTNFDFGPFARFYAGTTANVFRPFLHGDVNFTSAKTKTGSETSTSNGTRYFFGGGAAAFLNRNVALEGLAGYDHTAFKNQDGSGGFALKIGFQVYLNRAEVKAVTNTIQ